MQVMDQGAAPLVEASAEYRRARRYGLHVLEDGFLPEQAPHDLTWLHGVIDVRELGISSCQAADRLRHDHQLDMGLSDHRRVEATVSMGDDKDSTDRLVTALRELTAAAPSMPQPRLLRLPDPGDLDLDPVDLLRDAFVGPAEVPADQAVGRVAAEQITPYPPGIPAILPAERITRDVLDYLRDGLRAGMVLSDPPDQSLDTVRVTAR
jgi:arginine decarboxylase